MIVLCNGMHRSGSTWSFNVCVQLLRIRDPQSRLLTDFTSTPGQRIQALRSQCDHLIVKSHTIDDSAREMCGSGDVKAIYTHRDAYDAIASLMQMFQFSFEDALAAVHNSLRILEFHRGHGRALIVPYDSLMARPREMVSAVCGYLAIDVSPAQMDGVHAGTSFAAVKEASEKIGDDESAFVVRRGGDEYDTRTHLHRNHVRDGSSGYGRRLLSPEQCRSVGAMLDELQVA